MYKIDRMRGLILHEDHESSSKAQAGLQGKVWMEITRGSGQAEGDIYLFLSCKHFLLYTGCDGSNFLSTRFRADNNLTVKSGGDYAVCRFCAACFALMSLLIFFVKCDSIFTVCWYVLRLFGGHKLYRFFFIVFSVCYAIRK